jgi:uncharacterized membrane protein
MYNIFGVPRAIILNSEGKSYDASYVHDQESYSAKWLKENIDSKSRIYTDDKARTRLRSQGRISVSLVDVSSLIEHRECNGYIWLRYYNVINRKLAGPRYSTYNLSGYSHQFIGKSKIYSNGGSEVWK